MLVLSDWTRVQVPFQIRQAVARRCSVKKVFIKISQSSQENTCARVSFLIKFQAKRFTKIVNGF